MMLWRAVARWGQLLLAFTLAISAIARTTDIFKEDTKLCHPDCTKLGNCNGETGECDCPFGLTGPTCTERLFPACHSSKDPGTAPHYGTWFPKNCHCIKQLREHPLSCPDYLRYEGTAGVYLPPCLYDILLGNNVLCYRYKNLSEEDQLSDSPTANDPSLEWLHVRPYPTWHEAPLQPDQVPKTISTQDGGVWRPLSECPDRCNNRGWCQRQGWDVFGTHNDPDESWCNCHSYYQGKACEIADPIHCYRNCSGVGTCMGGWCHCQPGYWGHGCTRTKAYTSTVGWRPNHAEIKIYVYDLPAIIAHRREFNDNWAFIDLMYSAELEFTEQLLGDWGVRTENPWEAALFYVPIFAYWYTGNVGHPYFIHQHVTHHLQALGPFFNLTGGRNHILWATNDRGTCKLQYGQPELQHPIKLVHFGQSPRHPFLQHHHLGGANQGIPLVHALPLPGHRFEGFPEFNAVDILDEHEMCYRPEKDVVAPNVLHSHWVEPASYDTVWETRFTADGEHVVTRRSEDPARRHLTLFFGGFTKDQMGYSQGVRQALNRMFGPGGKYDPQGPNARKDCMVLGPVHDAPQKMQQSKFCLAPMGAGWGIRLTEAMVSGCVPVIIQDTVYQPLWDVLPFEEFSLRLPRTDVADLVEHLDDVTPQQLERLQAGVEKYHRAFVWEPHYGGLAYNYTITALKRRALHMWSVNYHHRHRRSSTRRSRRR